MLIAPDEIMREANELLSYEAEGASFARRYNPHWDGRKRLMNKKGVFPTGLLPRLVKYLKKSNRNYKLSDLRKKPDSSFPFKLNLPAHIEPRYYQNDAKKESQVFPRGVYVIGTGGGKTLTSALIVEDKKVQTLFVTPDTGLKRQAYTDYVNWFGHQFVGSDIREDKPIIISNIQALTRKKPEEFERFRLLITDEFHHAAASTYLDLNRNCKNAYFRYGMTGTFVRTDGSDMVMHGVLSNVIFRKPTSELIEEGFLVRPYITVFRVQVPKMRVNYKDAYDFIIKYDEFNSLVAKIGNEKIKEKKQTLILVRRKEHGRAIAAKMPLAIFVSGDDKTHFREKCKLAFVERRVPCLIATEIFGEGQDIPSIDCLINARAQKTEIQTMQGIGRALRKTAGKDKAEIFDFLFVGQKHLEGHSVERIMSYKKEPAFKIQIRRT